MKTPVISILSFLLFFFAGCDQLKGPAGPTGPAGSSGTDALTDASVALKVIWTFPANGQIGPITNLGNAISIRFNKILDMSTVHQSLQISPSNTGYARIDTNDISVFSGDVIYVYLQFDSSCVWNIGQTYTITVLSTLKDINGNTLSTPYSFSFTPEPYFRVKSTYPTNGQANVSRICYVELNFNNSFNLSSLQSSFSISPVISGTWYASSSYAYFNSLSTLNPNTVYTLTLSTDIKDSQGRSLSSPYTFSFTTGQ